MSRNSHLLWFCIITPSDWLKIRKLAPLFQPIRSETKTTRNSQARVFPRFTPSACVSLRFDWLTGLLVCFVGLASIMTGWQDAEIPFFIIFFTLNLPFFTSKLKGLHLC